MANPLSWSATIELFANRLPARALDTVIRECALDADSLTQRGITHDSIGRLLQEQGLRDLIFVQQEARKLEVSEQTTDSFAALDLQWRGEGNPFIPYVLEAVERLMSTEDL